MPAAPASRPSCLVSIDLEEWRDARLAGLDPAARDRGPGALEAQVESLLGLLDAAGARATFFTVGRLARRYPRLLRHVARRHEVACHGDDHADLRLLDARRLALDLRRSRGSLQDISGQGVPGYRAPNFSLGACLDWALPVLRREGVGYDSSLLPGRGVLFLPGRPGLPPGPHPLAGGEGMWEFPPTTVRLPGISFPAAGGAFLRILPRRFVMQALHRAASGGGTPHVYLHPWELGVSGAAPRLLAILQRFQGVAIDDLRVRLEERGAA